MALIKEPIKVDFSGKSEPWTEEELKDFRILMAKLKAKRNSIKAIERVKKASKKVKRKKIAA